MFILQKLTMFAVIVPSYHLQLARNILKRFKMLQVAALIRQNRGHLDQDRVLESVLLLKCFSEGGRS